MADVKDLLQFENPYSGGKGNLLDPSRWWSLILGAMLFTGVMTFGTQFWQRARGTFATMRAPAKTEENGSADRGQVYF